MLHQPVQKITPACRSGGEKLGLNTRRPLYHEGLPAGIHRQVSWLPVMCGTSADPFHWRKCSLSPMRRLQWRDRSGFYLIPLLAKHCGTCGYCVL